MGGTIAVDHAANRALVRAHPKPAPLVAAFEHENESSFYSLAASKAAANSLGAYRSFFKSLSVYIDDSTQSEQPLPFDGV